MPMRTATTYPQTTVVGLDGDAYSLEMAADMLRQGGVQDRASLVRSTLEDMSASEEFDVVLINVSMHECRDIEKVAGNVHRALKPDGFFVISDFPFPDSVEGTRTVPAGVSGRLAPLPAAYAPFGFGTPGEYNGARTATTGGSILPHGCPHAAHRTESEGG